MIASLHRIGGRAQRTRESRVGTASGVIGRASQTLRRDEMAKAWAGILVVAAVVASFLLAAPVIESATSGSTQVFQAVGTADGGSD